MNKKEAKAKIAALLAAGSRKADVFDSLAGQGVKDRVLANLIASRADPERSRKNRLHIRILVGLGIVQLLFSLGLAYLFLSGLSSLGPLGSLGTTIVLFFVAITVPLSLLFIWGFATSRIGAYNAYIVLSLIQVPKLIANLATHPSDSLTGLAIAVAIVGYVWFVRNRLFPDAAWFSPRKVDGRYVFTESA